VGTLTYGSLFAGVGGFDMGFDRAGYDCRFQVEWDKNCQSILRKHWPEVPKWGDVSEVSGTELPPVDVLIFGSPCQDLSVAGKRAGLDGARSGLFHEAMRIIKEMRHATEDSFPRVVVWENVVGALSSNGGADFGTVLDQMAEAGAMVVEWAVLDAQHFGVPQRRRRVFVVAVFDPAAAEGCPDPLLPVRESVRGDSAKGRKKGQAVADPVAGGVGSGGAWAAGESDGILRQSISAKWSKGSSGPSGDEYINMVVEPVIVGTLQVHDATKWGSHQWVNENKMVVEPFVKSRRAQTSDDDETWVPGQVNPTLNQFDMGDTRATTAIVEPTFFQMHQSGETRIQEGVMHTLAGYMGTGGNNTPMVAQPLSFDTQFGSNANVFEDMTPPLKSTQQSPSIADSMIVRRLTPTECERLMGWPDDHTRWTDTGKEQADTHRYRQCGNGVATPVAQWIAGHLKGIL